MVRWSVAWLSFIVVLTAGSYLGTRALAPAPAEPTLAMRVLGGGPGTQPCARATRALVAAGDGAQPTAARARQAAWDAAARDVLDACS